MLHAMKRTQGFTLLEVMSSLMVASIGLMGSFNLSMYLLRAGRWADRRQEATLAAESFLEEIRSIPYDELVSDDDTFHGCRRQWTVSEFDHYQVIDIVVTWDGVEGGSHRLAMQTLLTDPNTKGVTFGDGT